MVHRSTVKNNDGRLGFLKRIFSEPILDGGFERRIQSLAEDFVAANKIAASLTYHSKWIPYPFLVEHIKKISDEMSGQAEIFREKIIELGGQIPTAIGRHVSSRTDSGNRGSHEFNQDGHGDHRSDVPHVENVKRLVMDMEEHAARCEALMHQRNLTDDPAIEKLLSAVIVDMQRQKEELTDIVMRIS